MSDVVKKTLEKIKKDHLEPESRWNFLMQNFSRWLFAWIFIALGAIAISVVYYLVGQLDWDLPQVIGRNYFLYALAILPYFWLVILILFLVVSFWGIRKTERGYRFSRLKVVSITALSFVLLGLFFYFLGLSKQANNLVIKNVPQFIHHTVTKETQWMQPGQGLLAGKIIEIGKDEFQLEDLRKKNWAVNFNEETIIRPAVNLSPGEMIKIIGNQKTDNLFEAKEVRPWEGRGMMGGQQKGHMQR